MYDDELREAATRRVTAKTAFFITGIVFVCTTVVLVLLSWYLSSIAIWLLLPIPVMAMVLGIMYVLTFGFASSGPLTTEWREEAIEREIDRLRRERDTDLLADEDLSEADRLELRELARLREKWGE